MTLLDKNGSGVGSAMAENLSGRNSDEIVHDSSCAAHHSTPSNDLTNSSGSLIFELGARTCQHGTAQEDAPSSAARVG